MPQIFLLAKMINLKLNLGRKQLLIKLATRRGRPKRTLITLVRNFTAYLKKIYRDNRFRGNKISRVLRRVFEVRRIKQLIGVNLMFVVFFSGAAGKSISGLNFQTKADLSAYAINEIKVTTEKSIKPPLPSFRISQKYYFLHPAIDLKDTPGTLIHPIMNGTVEEAVFSQFGYGNHLIINHGSNVKSLYAHLQKIAVKKGEKVTQGTILGTVGSTGWSTGPHLHLEIWENGKPINPLNLLR